MCSWLLPYSYDLKVFETTAKWSAVARLLERSNLLGIKGLLVRVSPPAESLCCFHEQDTLSAA